MIDKSPVVLSVTRRLAVARRREIIVLYRQRLPLHLYLHLHLCIVTTKYLARVLFTFPK